MVLVLLGGYCPKSYSLLLSPCNGSEALAFLRAVLDGLRYLPFDLRVLAFFSPSPAGDHHAVASQFCAPFRVH